MCQPDRNLILPAYAEWENTAALEEYFTTKFWQQDFFSPTEISEQKFTVGFFFLNDFFNFFFLLPFVRGKYSHRCSGK